MNNYPIKIYIAGKITDNPNYKVDFAHLRDWLLTRYPSAIILNPATLPEGMTAADYMRICLAMIDSADLVVFDLTVKDSQGAKLEKDYCEYINKMYITITTPAEIIVHCPECKQKPEVGYKHGEYYIIVNGTGCSVCGDFSRTAYNQTEVVNDWNIYAAVHYALKRKRGSL